MNELGPGTRSTLNPKEIDVAETTKTDPKADPKANALADLDARVERLERMAGIPTGNAAKRIAKVEKEGREVVEAQEAEAAAKKAERDAGTARRKADAANKRAGKALAG